MSQFPFGRPVLKMPPRCGRRHDVFVLGAYPSALHIEWTLLSGEHINALAVDNEPTPFWTGEGERELIEQWLVSVGWDPRWGTVSIPRGYNGSSGRSVLSHILAPLGLSFDRAWVTDCLDEYHLSDDAKDRLDGDIGVALKRIGRSPNGLRSHPSEAAIFREAIRSHRERISTEMLQSAAPIIVTLGNAALRVMGEIVGLTAIRSLVPEPDVYGQSIALQLAGRVVEWYPLCHPGQRTAPWRDAHSAWVRRVAP